MKLFNTYHHAIQCVIFLAAPVRLSFRGKTMAISVLSTQLMTPGSLPHLGTVASSPFHMSSSEISPTPFLCRWLLWLQQQKKIMWLTDSWDRLTVSSLGTHCWKLPVAKQLQCAQYLAKVSMPLEHCGPKTPASSSHRRCIVCLESLNCLLNSSTISNASCRCCCRL